MYLLIYLTIYLLILQYYLFIIGWCICEFNMDLLGAIYWICWKQKPKYILTPYISLSDQFGDDNKTDEYELLWKNLFTHYWIYKKIIHTYIWTPYSTLKNIQSTHLPHKWQAVVYFKAVMIYKVNKKCIFISQKSKLSPLEQSLLTQTKTWIVT